MIGKTSLWLCECRACESFWVRVGCNGLQNCCEIQMETDVKRVLSKDEMMCCNQFLVRCIADYVVPLVHWHYWLGVRKSIRPVKTSDVGAGVVICLERRANDLHWSRWWHCHPTSCASLKSRCRLNHIVLEKRPLNECLSVCVAGYARACMCLVSLWVFDDLFFFILSCILLAWCYSNNDSNDDDDDKSIIIRVSFCERVIKVRNKLSEVLISV